MQLNSFLVSLRNNMSMFLKYLNGQLKIKKNLQYNYKRNTIKNYKNLTLKMQKIEIEEQESNLSKN